MAVGARWRKEKRETGLRGTARNTPYGHELVKNGRWLLKVSWSEHGWYWYGLGRNTYAERKWFNTADDAKKDATAAYKGAKP